MNIYYYLFYRVSKVLNKKGDNEWGPIGALSFFLLINIIVFYINVFQVNNENFNSGYKQGLIVIGIIIFLVNSVLFFDKKRSRNIIKRYEKESHKSIILGGWLVAIYIGLTFLSIFIA